MDIVFDTNMFGAIASPEEYPNLDNINDCKSLRESISRNKITPFISCASLGLESLSREKRIDEFFREWASKSSGITLPRPSNKRIEIVVEALSLGFKVLHVPRISLGEMIGIGDEAWANDVRYDIKRRQERTTSFMQNYEQYGLPILKNLGTELSRKHGLPIDNTMTFPGWPDPHEFNWIKGIVAEFDDPVEFPNSKAFMNKVRDIIAEMLDIDILASVYGYGFNLFCTNDKSKGTGTKGILHPTKFKELKENFEIEIITPSELIEMLK